MCTGGDLLSRIPCRTALGSVGMRRWMLVKWITAVLNVGKWNWDVPRAYLCSWSCGKWYVWLSGSVLVPGHGLSVHLVNVDDL